MQADHTNKHFGIMVRDDTQIAEIREKLTTKYKIELIPPFRCDFRDSWGNRIQVVDLHDESLVWLLPYQELQKTGLDSGNSQRRIELEQKLTKASTLRF